jgi:hypothetical protein
MLPPLAGGTRTGTFLLTAKLTGNYEVQTYKQVSGWYGLRLLV